MILHSRQYRWWAGTFVKPVLWCVRGEGVTACSLSKVWAVLFTGQEEPSSAAKGAQWSTVDGGDTLHTLKELEHKQPQFVN